MKRVARYSSSCIAALCAVTAVAVAQKADQSATRDFGSLQMRDVKLVQVKVDAAS